MTVIAIVVIGMVAFIVFAIIPFVVLPLVLPGRWSMFTTTAYLTKDLGKTYEKAYLEAIENNRLQKWNEELDEKLGHK